MRKTRDYGDAAEHAARRIRPGNPLEFIKSISELRPGDRVLVVCRVSKECQRANLFDQDDDLRCAVQERGGVLVAAPFKIVTPGGHPEWLSEAAKLARKHSAILIARDTSRFIRHPEFHVTRNPNAQPRDEDYRLMRLCADQYGPQTLMTLLPPDATLDEVRNHRTKGKSGRPKKRRNKSNYRQFLASEKLTVARWLGITGPRPLARFFDREVSTIQSWIDKWEAEHRQPWKKGGVRIS